MQVMELKPYLFHGCFMQKWLGRRWCNASFIQLQASASKPSLSFYDSPLCTQAEAPSIARLFHVYSSSSPPSLSMYFDRISFHCRCYRHQSTFPKSTPRADIRLCLCCPKSYPLLCHMHCPTCQSKIFIGCQTMAYISNPNADAKMTPRKT